MHLLYPFSEKSQKSDRQLTLRLAEVCDVFKDYGKCCSTVIEKKRDKKK